MSRLVATILAGLALVTAAAAVQPAPAGADRSAQAKATIVHVTGGEFFFHLSAKSIPKPGVVMFVFKNTGHLKHDFRIDGKRTPLTAPGKTSKLTVTFSKPAKYVYMCTVKGHAAAGMKGIFTVR